MRTTALLTALVLGATAVVTDMRLAAAAEMQPGLWRFTQRTVAGGRAWTKARTRCVTPAQAANPAQFFLPVGPGCALLSHTSFGSRVSSTLRCTNGPMTSNVTSILVIDSPTHLTITTAMTTTGNGREVAVGLKGEGTRTGNCGGRRRGRG